MNVFFQCVAEAVAEKGLRGLAELVPGGGIMFDVAKVTWEKYRQRRQMQQIRADVQQMAQANFADAKQAAAEAVKPLATKQPEIAPIVEQFLMQIPASIRQSLKRADDPTGTTVPANFSLRGPEDVAKLLPPSLPRFKPGDPLPGKAGWLLEKQLGIGGFGEVWLARKSGYESLLGAVKFCRSLDTRDRDLLHESKVIDQLLKHGDHPNIVKLMDVHLEGDAPWLMYEYVEGGDLTDLIHQWSALPPSERQEKALAALQELAAAIGHFHRLDPVIVHRDLKPANILRDKSGRLRITDFGISGIAAKHMIENETRGVTTRAGRLQSYLYGSYTPLYASKEQIDGGDPDTRDDVHALGVIAFQMLVGKINEGVGSDFAEDLLQAGCDGKIVEIVRKCAAGKAERRLKDAGEICDFLRTHIADKGTRKDRGAVLPKSTSTSGDYGGGQGKEKLASPAPPATKLYIGNLPYSVCDDDLDAIFTPHGMVVNAQVIIDRDTGRSKGFGFVEMGSSHEAEAAIAALNGKEIHGRILTVKEARPGY